VPIAACAASTQHIAALPPSQLYLASAADETMLGGQGQTEAALSRARHGGDLQRRSVLSLIEQSSRRFQSAAVAAKAARAEALARAHDARTRAATLEGGLYALHQVRCMMSEARAAKDGRDGAVRSAAFQDAGVGGQAEAGNESRSAAAADAASADAAPPATVSLQPQSADAGTGSSPRTAADRAMHVAADIERSGGDAALAQSLARHAPAVFCGDEDPLARRHTWLAAERESAGGDGEERGNGGEGARIQLEACEQRGGQVAAFLSPAQAPPGALPVVEPDAQQGVPRDLEPVGAPQQGQSSEQRSVAPPRVDDARSRGPDSPLPRPLQVHDAHRHEEEAAARQRRVAAAGLDAQDASQQVRPQTGQEGPPSPESVGVVAGASAAAVETEQTPSDVRRRRRVEEPTAVSGPRGLPTRGVGVDGRHVPPRVRDLAPVVRVEYTSGGEGGTDDSSPGQGASRDVYGDAAWVEGGERAATALAEDAERAAGMLKEIDEQRILKGFRESAAIALGIDESTFALLDADESELTTRQRLVRQALVEQVQDAERGKAFIISTREALRTRPPRTHVEQIIADMMKQDEEQGGLASHAPDAGVPETHRTRLQDLLFSLAVVNALRRSGQVPERVESTRGSEVSAVADGTEEEREAPQAAAVSPSALAAAGRSVTLSRRALHPPPVHVHAAGNGIDGAGSRGSGSGTGDDSRGEQSSGTEREAATSPPGRPVIRFGPSVFLEEARSMMQCPSEESDATSSRPSRS